MLDRANQFIEAHQMLQPGDTVIVAASGGADSSCLAHVLLSMRDRYDLRLHLFHLHHGLRGRQADADAEFVREQARKWDIPVTVAHVNVGQEPRHRQGVQAVARAVRYRELCALARQLGAQRVAVGHHQDDQAETVLMRLVRGTGTKGMAGMRPTRPLVATDPLGPQVIRPLLAMDRAAIEAYCREHSLPYIEDETNVHPKYLRNRVRHELIPLLKRYNARVVDHLAHLADLVRDEQTFLEQLARRTLLQAGGHIGNEGAFLPQALLVHEHRALVRQVLRLAVADLGHSLDFAGMQRLEDLLTATVPAHLALKGRLQVFTAPDGLHIRHSHTHHGRNYPATVSVPLAAPGIAVIPELSCRVEVSEVEELALTAGDVIVLDPQRLPGPLVLRTRRPGDRIYPVGMKGSKKVQDILVDCKVPFVQRDQVPVLVAGSAVVWVVGYRVDRRYLAAPAASDDPGDRHIHPLWRVHIQDLRDMSEP